MKAAGLKSFLQVVGLGMTSVILSDPVSARSHLARLPYKTSCVGKSESYILWYHVFTVYDFIHATVEVVGAQCAASCCKCRSGNHSIQGDFLYLTMAGVLHTSIMALVPHLASSVTESLTSVLPH